MEQEFREIQLGRKQIVFLFMALVVFSVAVFLLGISVGRGVREAGVSTPPPGTDMAVANPAPAPAEMPPATVTTPADLTYHDQLQAQTPPAASALAPAEPPTPPGEGPTAAASTAPARSTAVAAPARANEPAPKPAASNAPAARDSAPASTVTTTSGWHLQLYALRSRENANAQVARLKTKGYSASVVTAAGGLFKVIVGPFPQRSEAERVSERLEREEGLKPLIQR